MTFGAKKLYNKKEGVIVPMIEYLKEQNKLGVSAAAKKIVDDPTSPTLKT